MGRSSQKNQPFSGFKITVALLFLAALGTTWFYLPEQYMPEPETISEWQNSIQEKWYSPLLLLGVYSVGGLLMIPVTSLILSTAILYSPFMAFVINMIGMGLNTAAVYWTGRLFQINHPKIRRLRHRFRHHNIWTIAVIRMIPIAHFSIVSLALGSARIRFREVMAGTMLGMLPGTLIIVLVTDQVQAAWTHPDPVNIMAIIILLLAAVGFFIWIQYRIKSDLV
jgi:phospholipase D1/2